MKMRVACDGIPQVMTKFDRKSNPALFTREKTGRPTMIARLFT
jgi:hypothetical protein